jgi:GTP-binding protein
MAGLPIVAVVGRPNVGKSTLFNRVVGERTAIVEDKARTTRDRLYAVSEWNGRRFILVDTGGLERSPADPIEAKVQEQARLAIAEADVILFVVDAESGETPADAEAAELLRSATVPLIVAVNKADNQKRELEAAEFHHFGWDETYAISALHGRGTGDLLDALVWALPPESETELERKAREEREDARAEEAAELFLPILRDQPASREPDTGGGSDADGADPTAAWDAQVAADQAIVGRPVAISIVGRPNVGKSSLLNSLLGEERAIVSEIPGTTRDAIDTLVEWQGRRPIRLIDTAGVRRRGKVASGPAAERFSALRALRAIERCDVAILVVDAADGMTAQDAHVAGYVVEEGRGLVVALNKWDLVEKDEHTFDQYVARIRTDLPFLDFAPFVSVSARSAQRVGRVVDEALDIARERRRRIPTAELNRILGEATFRQVPPAVKGRRPKIYYGTQVAVEPPTFVLFASDPASVHFSYARYLENQLRRAFGFDGTPIRIRFRERERSPSLRTRRGPRTGRRSERGAPRARQRSR